MVIDATDAPLAHKRRNQHHQGRFRQMEVGHQRIGHPEPVAGIDEDIRLGLEGVQDPVFVRSTFDQPQRGGTDRDDPAPLKKVITPIANLVP